MDTESSYTAAVVESARWLLGEAATGIDARLVRTWKRLGDWNNDWDLVYGLYRWGSRLGSLPSEDAARLNLADLDRRAGAQGEYSYEDCLGVIEEFYLGTAAATKRHGIEARVRNDQPMWQAETVLLSADLMQQLAHLAITKIGIVTGRGLTDWLVVRERLPLGREVVVATDEDGRKPAPEPLIKVLRALRASDFIMVGDTLADLRMVNRYNADWPTGPNGIAVMVCPPADEPTYREDGAQWFVRSIDELPTVISAIRRGAVPRHTQGGEGRS